MTEHVFAGGRKVQSSSDMVYTVEQVGALVEEIKARTYDGVKARVLSLLEALLQAKGMGDSPAGRVLDILLLDVDRLILDIALKRFPEITPPLLDEKRRERLRTADEHNYLSTEERIRHLREHADSLERQTGRRRAEGLRERVLTTIHGAGVATLELVEEYLSRGAGPAKVLNVPPLKAETIYPRC